VASAFTAAVAQRPRQRRDNSVIKSRSAGADCCPTVTGPYTSAAEETGCTVSSEVLIDRMQVRSDTHAPAGLQAREDRHSNRIYVSAGAVLQVAAGEGDWLARDGDDGRYRKSCIRRSANSTRNCTGWFAENVPDDACYSVYV